MNTCFVTNPILGGNTTVDREPPAPVYHDDCPPPEDTVMTPTDRPRTSTSGYDLTPPTATEREQLDRSLSSEERPVILHQGTEPPFCGGLLANKSAGFYACRLCAVP